MHRIKKRGGKGDSTGKLHFSMPGKKRRKSVRSALPPTFLLGHEKAPSVEAWGQFTIHYGLLLGGEQALNESLD